MVIMFADIRGIILCHAVKRGHTVNSAYYSKVLRRDLVRAVEKKRPGIPISHFLLHHDNAPAYSAASTRLELSLLDLETVPHPAYSPDLAPMDFAVFPEVNLIDYYNINFFKKKGKIILSFIEYLFS